jgi:MurE/MurF fusion protein
MQSNRTLKVDTVIVALEEKNLFLQANLQENCPLLSKPETDSRKIEVNDIFICVKGYQVDGHDFAQKAIEKGAGLLITEKEIPDFPYILVKNSRKAAAVLANLHYETAKNGIKLVGITGTNGKTTTSLILFELLQSQGKKVGLIGTLGYQIMEKKFPLQHTTPDIIELHQILRNMFLENIEFVVMEVSSHALALDRVFGLNFTIGIFTNLSHDHLDFHKSIDSYAAEKFKLFTQVQGLSIFNIDDENGRKFYANCKSEKMSLSQTKADAEIKNVHLTATHSTFDFSFKNEQEKWEIPFIGEYNIYNFCLAFLACKQLLSQSKKSSFDSLLTFGFSVPGRLQRVHNKKNLTIYVDYAHTPDALENVLKTLKPIVKGRLLCIFGAGGDRDKSKRPKMLHAALTYADFSFVTNDNPRTENPADIIRDIVGEESFCHAFWIERDREKAIEIAVRLMTEHDILLIAGKGHETYQIFGDQKFPFDDREKVLTAIEKRGISSHDSLSIPIDIMNIELLFNQKLCDEYLSISHISTDSREILPNALYVALKGERFDGHKFVAEVMQRKHHVAVVENGYSGASSNLFFVENTLFALGKLARKYLSLFPALKIAITGSMGKTTTKEYLYHICHSMYPTLKTAKNENNQIGLPKTIFRLQPHHRIALFEIGTNHPGEIAYLSDICQPDLGIITNIAAVHTEFLGDEDGVFIEKSSLLERTSRIKFFPAEDIRFSKFSGITFGKTKTSDYRLSHEKEETDGISFLVNEQQYKIASAFLENVLNALTAIAVASELHIPYESIHAAIAKPLEISYRMQIEKHNKQIYIIDCYNANPKSMQAAIRFWQKTEPERKHIAILGDMLELGEKAELYHQEIGTIMKAAKADTFISIGNLAIHYQAHHHFLTVEDCIQSNILHTFPEDAIILLKASRSIHLEKVLEG